MSKVNHVIEILNPESLAFANDPACLDVNELEKALVLLLDDQGQASFAHEVHLHLASPETIQQLNRDHRDKNTPTNVLSFPHNHPHGISPVFLGDVILCPDVLIQEAIDNHLSVKAHTIHLWVHSLYHLFGYDHETDLQATEMEAKEVALLSLLGYSNPYKDHFNA